MAFLELRGIEKFYGPVHVVKNVSMAVEQGEFVSFLGPSGCGKTTTLRMIAGFETPTEGSIRIDGRDMVGVRPNRRNIGMVFQSYALFPNLTVAQNVGFGLKVARRPRAEIGPRVDEMLALVGLGKFGARYPFQLSGGQQQRVALARALAGRPQLLLLDEPLSALDAKIRVSLREEIRHIQKDLGITTIYVTHDQEEALSMSDRVVVMNAGNVEQLGTPHEVYNRPATTFVTTFVGQVSRLTVEVIDPAPGRVRLCGQEVSLGRPLEATAGSSLRIGLRPEVIVPGARPGAVSLAGEVEGVNFLGSVVRVSLRAGTESLTFDMFNSPATPPPRRGERLQVSFDPASAILA